MKKIDSKTLDCILESMVDTVGNSKNDIFLIGEQCQQDIEQLTEQLTEIKELAGKVHKEGAQQEILVEEARRRLTVVSNHFKSYSEAEIRCAYEKAHQLQMDLTVNRQLEKQLLEREEDLERRLRGLHETVEKSEQLSSQVTVVMNYLMSDLKQMGQMIRDAKLKEDFGLRIIEAQEEERKRISREIHDGPAQMLANLMVRSDLIEYVYKGKGPEEAFVEVRSLKESVRSTLREVRRIIYDLRPMALDDLGLVPTLKKYLQTIEEYNKASKIYFTNYGTETRLPTKHEVALFRLVQEAVQNAYKHAEATVITVTLDIKESHVTVMIKDDGKGFNVNEVSSQSFGIIGMKERVDLLDGMITIDSELGAGTVILIQVPLTN